MNAILDVVLVLCLAPALATAHQCRSTFVGDNLVDDLLIPRAVCVCTDIGCGLVDGTVEPGPVAVLDIFGVTTTFRWHEDDNVWIGETPAMAVDVRVYTRQYDKYLLYYMCAPESDFILVEFPDKNAVTEELLQEILDEHAVDISPDFLMDC